MIIYWIILVVYKLKQMSHAGDMKIIVCKFVTFAHVCVIENDRETRFLNGFVSYEKGIKSVTLFFFILFQVSMQS